MFGYQSENSIEVVRKDICYFSKMKKGQFLSQAMKHKKENRASKILIEPKHRPWNRTCFVFSQMKKISARIRWRNYTTTVGLLYLYKM